MLSAGGSPCRVAGRTIIKCRQAGSRWTCAWHPSSARQRVLGLSNTWPVSHIDMDDSYIHTCIYIYIYTYTYICIYIHTCLVRHGNRQDVLFFVFRRRHHPTFVMVSVVGCLWFPSSQETFLCYGFRRWFLFMVSVVAGKRLLMVSVAGFSMDSAVAGGSKVLERIE